VGTAIFVQLEGHVWAPSSGDVRPLHAEPDPGSGVLARIEGKVVGRLLGCPKGGDWCQVQVAGLKGWLRRNEMWGVYKEEEID
jgi:SH3-like domain-containing protein